VIVIGISQDTVEEHREFKHKYNINFELLSDPTLETIKGLGAYGKVFVDGIEKEKVIGKGILVDDEGHILKELEPLKIKEEVEDVIKVVRSLKSH